MLVNDLLDISQIESGRVTLLLEPLNLEQIAGDAIEDFLLRISEGERNIFVEKAIDPDLPLVQADPDKIRRVIDNLLENAYLYNLPDGWIRLSIRRTGMELQVDVKDSGVGISPIDKGLVFDRFFRGENSLTLGVSGTGLGLSIVKNLIEMQGGRIWVESSGVPGEGSIFSFTLPVYFPKKLLIGSEL
jgi:signal transduction histidine kinase